MMLTHHGAITGARRTEIARSSVMFGVLSMGDHAIHAALAIYFIQDGGAKAVSVLCRAVHPPMLVGGSGSAVRPYSVCGVPIVAVLLVPACLIVATTFRAGRQAVGWAGAPPPRPLVCGWIRCAARSRWRRADARRVHRDGSMRTLLRGIWSSLTVILAVGPLRDGYPWSGNCSRRRPARAASSAWFSPAGSLPGRTCAYPCSRVFCTFPSACAAVPPPGRCGADLVHRQPVGDVGLQGRRAGTVGDHVRDDPLAEVGIGFAHHGGLPHRGWVKQGRLDLTRADPIATGLMRSVLAPAENPGASRRRRRSPRRRCGTSRPPSSRRRSPPALRDSRRTSWAPEPGVPRAPRRRRVRRHVGHDPGSHPGSRGPDLPRPSFAVCPGTDP